MKFFKPYKFLDSSLIKVQGEKSFRFINVCVSLGVDFYEMSLHTQDEDEEYLICVKNKDVNLLKEASIKTGVKYSIIKEYGLLVNIRKFFSRKTFYISIALGIVFLYSLTLFIWQINITGCVNRDESDILEIVKTSGAGYGIFKSKIDCQAIEDAIRNELNDVLWVSVSINGTGLFIQIKENTYLNDKLALEDGSADMVADSEGVVVSMVTRTGVPMVNIGDSVKEGDVLISGVKEYQNDAKEVYKTEHVYADGDIIIEKQNQYTWKYSNEINVKCYTKKKTGYNIRLFDKKIFNYQPNMDNEDCDKLSENNVVVLGDNFYLPLTVNKTFYKAYEYEERIFTDDSLEMYAKIMYRLFCQRLEIKGVDIIEKNATIMFNDSGCVVTANIITQQKCGVHKPITVEPIEEVIQEEETD